MTSPENVQAPAGSGREAFDISSIYAMIKRRWMMIAGAAAIGAVLAVLVVLQIPPRYAASATVAIETRKTQVVNLAQVVEDPTADQAAITTQAEILHSPDLLARVVSTLRLDNDREFAGTLPDNGRASLSADEIAARKFRAANALAGHVTISPLRNSYILSVQATSEDGPKAAKIANALVDAYIADQIESKFEATRRANAWLEKRVEELRVASVAADKAAEEYRIQNGLVGGDGGSTVAGQQLSEVNSQVVMARAARAEKQAQLTQITRLLASGNAAIESSSAILQSGLIASLRGQETEVLRKLSELRSVYGENHPKIINANAELRDLREKIRSEIQKIATSTANDLAVAQARERALDAGLASATGKSGADKIAEVRYRELLTEAQSAKLLYENFLNRYKETSEQLGIQLADARIIAPAQAPGSPAFPNKPLALLLGLALGLGIGIAVALVLEWFDPYVRTAEEMEELIGEPVLAMVPLIPSGGSPCPEEAVMVDRKSATSEALVALKAAMEVQLAEHGGKVVMTTSSIASEGKTFLALSLARSLATSGQRVLLMDLDLRRPRVAEASGLREAPGFAEIVLGERTFEQAVLSDPLSNLDILLAGERQETPDDLLHADAFPRLLAYLRERYDTIIVDSAPIAPISDSQVIGRHVDTILLAVAWAKAPVSVVKHTVAVLRRLKLPLHGGVMTLVDLKRYASYDRLGYSYYYHRYKTYTYGA